MKQILGILILCGGLADSASAYVPMGPGGTGGGKGIVCRNSRGKIIKSVEVLDLWEAREIYQRRIGLKGSIKQLVDQAFVSLKKSIPTRLQDSDDHGNSIDNEEVLSRRLREQADLFLNDSKRVLRKRNIRLTLTDDSYESAVPADCSTEQIVRYENQSPSDGGSILINQDLWDKMDSLNKAALIVHEAYYQVLRDLSRETSSLRVRRAVGLAFSGYQFSNVRKRSPREKNIVF